MRILGRSRLAASESGATVVEFATGFPIFAMLLFGIFEIGTALYVNTALRGAIADGARFASTFPAPTQAEITERIKSSNWGIEESRIAALTFDPGVQNGIPFVDINLRYNHPFDVVFWQAATLKFNHQQRAYMYPAEVEPPPR